MVVLELDHAWICFVSIVFGDWDVFFMEIGSTYRRQYLDNELRFQRVGAPWVLEGGWRWAVWFGYVGNQAKLKAFFCWPNTSCYKHQPNFDWWNVHGFFHTVFVDFTTLVLEILHSSKSLWFFKWLLGIPSSISEEITPQKNKYNLILKCPEALDIQQQTSENFT